MKARAHAHLATLALGVLGGLAHAQSPGSAADADASASAVDTPVAAPAYGPEERDAIQCLRALRKKERASDAELAQRLSRAGPVILPLLFRVLVARAVPALDDGDVQILSEVQEHAILLAVAELERGDVLAFVAAQVTPGADARIRHAALACVGAVGRSNDVLQLFGLAMTPTETVLDERLGRALRRALAAVIARDEHTIEQLIAMRRLTHDELLPTLIEAVGASRRPRGLAYLSELAYWHDELIVPIMTQVSLLGPSGDETIDAEMRLRLRAQLDESRPGNCRAAITALTALQDDQAIGALIELLGSESSGLRDNAHWALRQLTGLSLAPEPSGWARWHQAELYWQLRFKAREFQRLRDGDPAVAADALRTILAHPLAKKELASALPDLLKSRYPAIRVLACNTLASVGAKEAVSRLVWTLEDPDPDVARAAHSALRVLTRLDLPNEPVAWQSATDTDPRGTEL